MMTVVWDWVVERACELRGAERGSGYVRFRLAWVRKGGRGREDVLFLFCRFGAYGAEELEVARVCLCGAEVLLGSLLE